MGCSPGGGSRRAYRHAKALAQQLCLLFPPVGIEGGIGAGRIDDVVWPGVPDQQQFHRYRILSAESTFRTAATDFSR